MALLKIVPALSDPLGDCEPTSPSPHFCAWFILSIFGHVLLLHLHDALSFTQSWRNGQLDNKGAPPIHLKYSLISVNIHTTRIPAIARASNLYAIFVLCIS